MFGDHSSARAGPRSAFAAAAILIHGKDLEPVRPPAAGITPDRTQQPLAASLLRLHHKSSFSYTIELTTESACATYSPILAHLRGRLPETSRRRSGEWRPAAAARNRRPREVRDPARQALRPGCEELAALIRGKCRRRKRGPRPKIATVERREASASRWTR